MRSTAVLYYSMGVETTRYSRLLRYAGYSTTLAKWQQTTAAVVGLGGLGSGLVLQLARMGLKRLVLIDRDIVGEENLGYQLLYTPDDVQQGLPKAVAAGQYVRQINPAVQTTCLVESLTRNNSAELLAGVNLLFDGLDNYYSRMLLNDYSLKHNLPYFYAGVVRNQLSAKAVIPGRTACLRCIMPDLPAPGEVPTCAAEGVFPPLLGVANALQLDLANSWLAGTELEDILFSLSTSDWRLHQLKLPQPDPQCPACGLRRYDYLDGTVDPNAARSCHPGRVEASIHGGAVELELVAKKLLATDDFEVRLNKYCLVAVNASVRYTLFASGRVVLEGSDGPHVLDSFIATYLGV